MTNLDKRNSKCRDPQERIKTLQGKKKNDLAGDIPQLEVYEERYISYTLY